MTKLSHLLVLLLLVGPVTACPNAIKINTIYNYRGTLHIICLRATGPHQLPRLDVIQHSNQQVVLSRQVNEIGTNQLASFVDYEGNLRILVAAPNRVNGTSMYSIDSRGVYLDETHTINSQNVEAMAIWRLELNWEWQLAVANKPVYDPYGLEQIHPSLLRRPLPEPKPMISIHSWRATYFDSYQVIYLPQDGRINKLEPMHINDQEFLLVAMESHKHDNYPNAQNHRTVNSLIYKIDFSDGTLRWELYQTLDTRLALDVSSFAITHKNSLQRDNFIAMIGQQESSNRTTTEYGLMIYKYLGDQFIKVNSIHVPGAARLDTISYGSGDTYAVIALLNGWTNQINLFNYDGLNLSPMVAPTRPMRRSMATTGDLRLFTIPTSTGSELNKRTLSDASQMRPAIAFSTADSTEGDQDRTDANQAWYEIPTTDLDRAQDETSQPDGTHTKRNMINALGPSEDLLAWCKSTINSIVGDNFDASAKRLHDLPRIDQPAPIELTGDLIIDGDLHVSNLLYANRIAERMNIGQLTIEDKPSNFSQTFREIEQAHQDIDNLKRQVDAILVDDGTLQDVHTPLRFERIVFECSIPTNMDPRLQQTPFIGRACPQVGEIRTIYLNQRDIADIQRQARLTGRSMTITQDVRFEHLVLRGNVQIMGGLNGVPIDDIVFGREANGQAGAPITGHKNFKSGLFSTANLAIGQWNNQRIDRDSVLVSSGEQSIEAARFSHVVIDANSQQQAYNVSSRIEHLNGLHLDTHLNQIALSSADNDFALPLYLDELIINGPMHSTANSRLSTHDIEDVWSKTMFKHSYQNITAPVEFAGDVHVSYGGDIVVNGPINNVILESDNVLMRNRAYSLPNPIIFEGDVTVNRLQVEMVLNDIQVTLNPETGQYELAILYDGGNQLISGDKIFNEVYLGGYSSISGLINGHLNLTQLYNLANNFQEPFRFSSVRLSGANIRVADTANIHIDNMINGIPANDICSLATRVARSTSNSYRRLRFDQSVDFKSLRCASINGFNNLSHSFMTKYGNQHVAGTLKFVNGLILNTTLEIGSNLNGLNVRPLQVAVAQTINESRTGHKDIYGDFLVDDLIVNRINNLQLADVFLSKSDFPQYVRAPMIFDHLDIENVLNVRDIYTNMFNGLNTSDLFANTLQYDTPQYIYNHVELQTLHLLPGANLMTKSLNGHDLRRLYSDSVLIDVPQQILAPKEFLAPVELRNAAYLRFGIDGLSEDLLKFNLLLQSDELISDDVELADVTINRELDIQSALINDVDLNTFIRSILDKSQPNFRIVGNSSVRFRDVQANNLVVTGTIQGLDVSRDALLKSDLNNTNTYEPALARQRLMIGQQQLIDQLAQRGGSFPVASRYRSQDLVGKCHVHSCPTRYLPVVSSRPPALQLVNTTTVWRPQQNLLRPMSLVQEGVAPVAVSSPGGNNRYNLQPYVAPVAKQQQQPPPLPLAPTGLNPYDIEYVEHMKYLAQMKAQAIMELRNRLNPHFSASFFYEYSQKHPLLGPLLDAAPNPTNSTSELLIMKAANQLGEPCLRRNQTIDIMAPGNTKHLFFKTTSRIMDTASPLMVKSLVLNQKYYLFILDTSPAMDLLAVLRVHIWDPERAMYTPLENITMDGIPIAMKTFKVNQLEVGCVALANPRVTQHLENGHSVPGAIVLYCQEAPGVPYFSRRIVLTIPNVFEFDLISSNVAPRIIIAALSSGKDTEQLNELTISSFSFVPAILTRIQTRSTVRALKLHFINQPRAAYNQSQVQLVLAEAITSNDEAQALTRLFTLSQSPDFARVQPLRLSQIIKDNQFYDIQSIVQPDSSPLVFLQSAHSISIYAPPPGCAGGQLALVQRLPTKGATKFLVFNNRGGEHYLVLSSDDCEHQRHSTAILRSVYV